MPIKIDETQMKCLMEYVKFTGISQEDCIYQALNDWIRTVARTISQTEKFNVVAMLPRALMN